MCHQESRHVRQWIESGTCLSMPRGHSHVLDRQGRPADRDRSESTAVTASPTAYRLPASPAPEDQIRTGTGDDSACYPRHAALRYYAIQDYVSKTISSITCPAASTDTLDNRSHRYEKFRHTGLSNLGISTVSVTTIMQVCGAITPSWIRWRTLSTWSLPRSRW